MLAATVSALLLLGYHPFAEDGGIYTAAVAAHLHPHLFPHDHVWVTAHTRFALFVPLTANLTRLTHLPLTTVLFALYIAGLLATLAAAAHLARTCFPASHPWLALLAIAAGAGLPVAGTGLYAVDPYCTARSLTTPLLLFAVSLALRRRWWPSALGWIAAAVLHPLMAIWGALPLLLVTAPARRHPRRWVLTLAALAVAAALAVVILSPRETPGTYAVAHTRGYWFPAQWRWYEWLGAIAPCALLAALAHGSDQPRSSPLRTLAFTASAASAIAAGLALCFARESAASLAVARLQPMRSLHLVFLAFLVVAAAFAQSRLRTLLQTLTALAVCCTIAVSTFAMQRSLFAHTPHLEWPGSAPVNSWEAAFAWCRDNTPASALFALDSDYIDQPGEDSHGFRSLALRSALPDNVKDAGIAAVLPALTSSWQTAVAATANLNQLTDAQRRQRLLPLGVTWIVLPTSSGTGLPCPFRNPAAQVCRLR